MDCGNFYLCFFTILMGVHTGWTQESNFHVKESCMCPGATVHNLTYECTTIGHGTTLWRGTAFNCSASGNEIALRHARFKNPGGASNQCNNGNITGRSLQREGERYTSQIHVIVTPDLLGRTIECVHNNFSSYELIGNSTITITTDPLPPPDDITLSEIRLASALSELRFNWTKNMLKSCHISYAITSDCGDCPSSTATNTVICINVPVNNRTCSFTVRTVACGNIDGTHSNSISVTLKVPDAPSIDAVPMYSHETGHLVGIKTIFMEPAPFTITNGIDGGATSYTITYTEASSGNICDSETIPSSSSCSAGICTHLFYLSSSSCGSAPISVKALATNIFGPGPVSSPITIFDTINIFFNVTFDLSSDAAICTFLNQHESATKTCTLIYNQSENCQLDTLDTSHTAQSASDIVRVSFPFVNNLHDGTERHCFFVSASNGTYRAIIQGTLNTGCDPNHLYAGAVVPSSPVAVCDPPLSYIGTSEGYACYSGTLVGSYAVHRCLNCDYRSVRVCTADGNWNGTTPQCKIECSLKEPFLNQLSLSIVIPIIVLAILSLVFVIVTITVIIKKQRLQRKKVKVLQTQVMDPPDPEISTIYEEIANDSKPEQIMEENMAYNTVQEFQKREKSEAIPWPDSQLESKPKQIMEENMAYNTMKEFQEREESPDSQLESKPEQIMEENMAYNNVKSKSLPVSIDVSQSDTDSKK